jgi:hypothetical protein
MALPSTQPLEGEFWYVLDDQNEIAWRPRPKLRGDFYLGWLGQNKNVVGAGLARIEQGQLTHICTHGTPYFWLQPYEALPITVEVLRAQQVLGADTAALDFSLAGWGLRDQTAPPKRLWSDAPVPSDALQSLLPQAVVTIVRNFRIEGEPPPPSRSEYSGLLARAMADHHSDPLDELLDLLKETLDEPNVAPVLVELVRHDINVMPGYRQSSFFEQMPIEEDLPSTSKIARVVLSAVYHLAPLVGSRRLDSTLLLNCLRQRHPFDVTWGADFLVKCYAVPGLVRLLLAALHKEPNDQIRGNALDLLQDLGYGLGADLGDDVLNNLTGLLDHGGSGGFGQVVNSHLAFLQAYVRQRDAAAQLNG